MKYFLISMLVVIFTYNCATSPSGYYWGNYSGVLYNYKKNPNDESLDTLINELRKIIEINDSNNMRTPPGIHAELGYRLAQKNEKGSALNEFQNEMSDYPESKTFIERVLIMLGMKE